MATYADMFEYASFTVVMNDCTIEYSDVTLLKDMCKKKAGTKLPKIVLNPKTGAFTVPRAAPVTVKKAPVEFKGVHTRFEDEEHSSLDKPKKKRATKKEKTIFKVYKGRCIHKVDDKAFEQVTDSICFNLNLYGTDMKKHFSIDTNGCIVFEGNWGEFDTKTRYKTESGEYSFKRIA